MFPEIEFVIDNDGNKVLKARMFDPSIKIKGEYVIVCNSDDEGNVGIPIVAESGDLLDFLTIGKIKNA